MSFCKGPACVNNAYRAHYCDDCEQLRHQQQISHEKEGHSSSIVMCPLCEQINQFIPEAEPRTNKCPKRGPGLSHTMDTIKRPDGRCLECGVLLKIG